MNSILARRGSLAALLIATLVAYLTKLSSNGWGNSFYAAAIQAGSHSWKAWFFGSSDMANSITVDKPPASLWLPGLSVRLFGLNSWAMLVPEVLMGVGSVALLYFVTRRYFGHWAGILAGSVLAATPVAALMFRFNNPEALLVLLMIAAVWAALRAMEDGRTRWLVLCGVFIGFAFLTKQMAALLIVPGIAVTYLILGPHGWGKRIAQLFAALAGLVVSAGWWILTVELWPASSRPYIGGSPSNSILELTLGYNGIGRLDGNERGSVTPGGKGGFGDFYLPGGGPGGGHRGSMFGEPGILRMFESGQGGQIAWLIPAALIVAIVGLVLLRGRAAASETDDRRMQRSYLVMWGLWLLVTMGTFSFMAGIFHSYYTAALAPAVAAMVAGGSTLIWRHRDVGWVRLIAAATAIGTAGWSFALLARSESFVPWLKWTILVVGIVGGLALLIERRSVAIVGATLAIVAGVAGPVAYTLDTIATSKSGSIISAGPQVNDGMFGPGRGPGDRGRGGWPGSGERGSGGRGPGGEMSAGGLLQGSTPSARIVALLTENADNYTWVASAVGSNSASGYQLAADRSVMPIGGFNGTDPSPTLETFKAYVGAGKIHYFIAGGREFGGSDETRQSSKIATWVEQNFTPITVDDATLYDLTKPLNH